MYTSGSSKTNYELLQEYLLNQQTIEDTIVVLPCSWLLLPLVSVYYFLVNLLDS